MLGLRKTYGGRTFFPLAALFEKLYALEAFEDGTFAADGGCGFERVVLGHRWAWLDGWGAEANRPPTGWQCENAGFLKNIL